MSVNKVILIGNVGKDPDVRYLDSGIAVATFSLATTERGYTLQNGTQGLRASSDARRKRRIRRRLCP